jgi:hypothetical protein
MADDVDEQMELAMETCFERVEHLSLPLFVALTSAVKKFIQKRQDQIALLGTSVKPFA